jgi:hypothetical protein
MFKMIEDRNRLLSLHGNNTESVRLGGNIRQKIKEVQALIENMARLQKIQQEKLSSVSNLRDWRFYWISKLI